MDAFLEKSIKTLNLGKTCTRDDVWKINTSTFLLSKNGEKVCKYL